MVRSKWEKIFCDWMYSHGVDYQYEPQVFDFGLFTYTPDIFIPSWGCYVEIKGWWERHQTRDVPDLVKFVAFLEKYGNIILLERPEVETFKEE